MTFVVLTVDQFVEHGDGSFELQKQDSHVFRKKYIKLKIYFYNYKGLT